MMTTWAQLAACRGEDPELFFPISDTATETLAEALAICGHCPVRDECLNEAIDRGHQGIWGGTTDDQLRKLRFRRWSRAAAPEATTAPTSDEQAAHNRAVLAAALARDDRESEPCS